MYYLVYDYIFEGGFYRLSLRGYSLIFDREIWIREWHSRQWQHLLNFAMTLDQLEAAKPYKFKGIKLSENIDH